MLSQANQGDNRSDQEPVASALLSKCAQVVLQNLNLAPLTSLLQHKSIQVKSQTLESLSLSFKLRNASSLQKDSEDYSNLFSRLEDMILDHNEDDGLRSKAAQVLVDHCLDMAIFVEERRDRMGDILDRLCKIVWESHCMPLSEAVFPYLASLCRLVSISFLSSQSFLISITDSYLGSGPISGYHSRHLFFDRGSVEMLQVPIELLRSSSGEQY